jgi:hypothetical protein
LIPQVFVLFILPLTALVLVLAFGGLYMHRLAMRTLVAERDARSARAAAALIGEQISNRRALLLTLVQEIDADTSPNGLETALQQAAALRVSFDLGLALLSPQGELLAASGDSGRSLAAPGSSGLQARLPAGMSP